MRIMLSPVLRRLVVYGIPVAVALGGITIYFADLDRRDMAKGVVIDAYRSVIERPEFMVNVMAINGASAALDADIREILPVDFPMSQFDIELDVLHGALMELDAVKQASVQIRTGGVLQIDVMERQPALIWRMGENLDILDATGAFIRAAVARTDYPHLPLIAGEGANMQTAKALELFAAVDPIADRVRGLVYVGERRWDVVLTQDQRILLPEQNPVQALERVLVLNQAQDLLDRDLRVVDLRLPNRPTLRVGQTQVDEILQSSQAAVE
jgi:cell division protein FtsQ